MVHISISANAIANMAYWNWENTVFKRGRKLRASPLYTRVEGDAVCGQYIGYERPLYFLTSSSKSGSFTRDHYCTRNCFSMIIDIMNDLLIPASLHSSYVCSVTVVAFHPVLVLTNVCLLARLQDITQVLLPTLTITKADDFEHLRYTRDLSTQVPSLNR